jgi:hypothetical protein
MEYLSNLDFIAELAHDITKSRNTPYSNYTPGKGKLLIQSVPIGSYQI